MYKWIRKILGWRGRKFTRPFLERNFPVFHPDSANWWFDPNLTYRSANLFPSILADILASEATTTEPRRRTSGDFASGASGAKFRALLNKYRSSKADVGYEDVYAAILDDLLSRPSVDILEIGIGTTTKGLVSAIGGECLPGGSLRAMRDYIPQATVYGADIDSHILFSEERIRTAQVDQTDPASLKSLQGKLRQTQFDFIIDDGLHSPEANLNTLRLALGIAKPQGWVLIEDIPKRALPIWLVVARVIASSKLECTLVETQIGLIFIAKRVG